MGTPGTVTQWQDGMAPDTTSATHVHVHVNTLCQVSGEPTVYIASIWC